MWLASPGTPCAPDPTNADSGRASKDAKTTNAPFDFVASESWDADTHERLRALRENEAFRAMQAGEVIRSVIDYQ